MTTATLSTAQYAALPPALNQGRKPANYWPTVSERLADAFSVALECEASGYPIGGDTAKARTLRDAALAAISPEAPTPFDGLDLLTLTEAQMADTARAAAAAALVRLEHRARSIAEEQVDAALYPLVTQALRADTDITFKAMAKDFNAAVEAVRRAHKSGLTTTTTRDQIVDTGTPDQLANYRHLGAATATLDRLAALRIRACNLAGLGPQAHPIACLVAGTTDLDGAQATYTGQTMNVLIEPQHPSSAPAVRTVTHPRLGGPWLALIEQGYAPRLNTSDEADAIVADAKKARADEQSKD